MSMTLEEAIKNREEFLQYLEGIDQKAIPDCVEAVRWSVKALKALRPVSREQVEPVRAHWITVIDTSGRSWSKCSGCQKELDGMEDAYDFCPNCGAPMTDEAVDMVMERMEGMYEET